MVSYDKHYSRVALATLAGSIAQGKDYARKRFRAVESLPRERASARAAVLSLLVHPIHASLEAQRMFNFNGSQVGRIGLPLAAAVPTFLYPGHETARPLEMHLGKHDGQNIENAVLFNALPPPRSHGFGDTLLILAEQGRFRRICEFLGIFNRFVHLSGITLAEQNAPIRKLGIEADELREAMREEILLRAKLYEMSRIVPVIDELPMGSLPDVDLRDLRILNQLMEMLLQQAESGEWKDVFDFYRLNGFEIGPGSGFPKGRSVFLYPKARVLEAAFFQAMQAAQLTPPTREDNPGQPYNKLLFSFLESLLQNPLFSNNREVYGPILHQIKRVPRIVPQISLATVRYYLGQRDRLESLPANTLKIAVGTEKAFDGDWLKGDVQPDRYYQNVGSRSFSAFYTCQYKFKDRELLPYSSYSRDFFHLPPEEAPKHFIRLLGDDDARDQREHIIGIIAGTDMVARTEWVVDILSFLFYAELPGGKRLFERNRIEAALQEVDPALPESMQWHGDCLVENTLHWLSNLSSHLVDERIPLPFFHMPYLWTQEDWDARYGALAGLLLALREELTGYLTATK